MLADFIIPFVTIGLAEIGDKTQLAIILLSSRTKEHLELFSGAMLAFALSNALAVVVGSVIASSISEGALHLIAGTIFIAFGVWTLLEKEGKEGAYELKRPFATAFMCVFAAEMGDKTQLSAALFASRYDPLVVFLGAGIALALVSGAAVYLGNAMAKLAHAKTIRILAGALFMIIGLWFIIF